MIRNSAKTRICLAARSCPKGAQSTDRRPIRGWPGQFTRGAAALLLSCLGAGGISRADVVAVGNDTSIELRVVLAPIGDAAGKLEQTHSIAAGRVVPLYCTGRQRLRIEAAAQRVEVAADANSAFRVYERDNGDVAVDPLPLGGDGRTAGGTGIAAAPPREQLKVIPARILVDDNQRAAPAAWQHRLKRRVELASDIIERFCQLRINVVGFGEWTTDESISDFAQSLAEFEREVPRLPGGLVIGFTSQYPSFAGSHRLGGTRGWLHSHILVSEEPTKISEAERVEVLVHELGHFLGAGHSTDENSVMRPLLGDRKARSREFPIQFDPANVVAVNLVAQEIRLRQITRRHRLTPATSVRLSQLHLAMETAMRAKVAAEQERLAKKTKPAVTKAKPKKAAPVTASETSVPKKKPTSPAAQPPDAPQTFADEDSRPIPEGLDAPLVEGTRHVVQQVVRTALAQAKSATKPHSDDEGDRLTATLIRAAAAAAEELPAEIGHKAFPLGLGIALDRSPVLLLHDSTGRFCRAVETPVMRSQRLRVLGNPTIKNRGDLLQHFVVSAHLTVAVGWTAAEAAGVAKEMIDSQRSSGFSFVDLAANKAGIQMARRLAGRQISLKEIASGFTVEKYMPAIDGLPEGLDAEAFAAQFSAADNDRYAEIVRTIHQRLGELPPYRAQP